MELKTGYKKTEVGVIPEDWECIESGNLAAYFGGNSFSSKAAVGVGIRWLKIANVGKQQARWEDVSYLPTSFATDFKEYLLYKGDVVMALTRPILDNELKIAKLNNFDVPSLLNQRVAKIIVCPNVCLDFMYYTLQTRHFVDSMNEVMAGTDPPNIGSRALAQILIAAPPNKAEQRAIASALSDVDALISSLDKLIAKKRKIKQAAMQQLLTGKKRLPGFSGEWETKTFGEIFNFLSTASNPRSDLSGSGDTRYVHYGDIHTRALSHMDCSVEPLPRIRRSLVPNIPYVEDGDLIMVDASEDYKGIGKTIEVRNATGRNIVAGLHTLLLRGNKQLLIGGFAGYLQYIPNVWKSLTKLATGISVYGVSKSNVKSVEVLLPPVGEQSAIANVLSDMDAEITSLEKKRDKTRLIKQGMMQELLTGKKRLI